ncbi:isopeptide-forming domain-containing fimbrial protein [Bacillus pumilus]|uniref:isopeptide-forming domain-containing fimbrial protein n=6 Tax=Bacillus pumilus TaxID=1408 RepID=UPI001B82C3CE|nr:isopeptide-forming domain-containing fimbrial protein [Bacillus pumilus sxm20-2]
MNILKRTSQLFLILVLIAGNLLTVSPPVTKAAGTVVVNNTDSYMIGNGKLVLYQLDGQNPTNVKASVQVKGINSSVVNGVAVNDQENTVYATTTASGEPVLYKINATTGQAERVGVLGGKAPNAVVYNGKYIHSYTVGGEPYLATYDLATGQKTAKKIAGYDVGPGIGGDIGGDLVVDKDGYLWFASNTSGSIAQMNPETAEVIRVIPITNADGKPIEGGVRGISFLPNGQMLLQSGKDDSIGHSTLFTLDAKTLSTTYMGTAGDSLSYDLASRVKPEFDPYPPNLESEKSVALQKKAEGNTDEKNPEVGDTLLYTIRAKNTVQYGILKNLTISDNLPSSLAYVPGSLKVDGAGVTDAKDQDKGDFTNGTVTGQIGDVKDTDWHTVTFEAKVAKGQAGKDIQNTANVKGENTPPDKPTTNIEIYPRDPKLESEKSAVLQKKADGNTDEKHPEVGDTLLYTIQARNAVEDSVIEDLVISDKLPQGLSYVPNSLQIDGNPVTDTKDDDNGDMTGGTVTGTFGEVKDAKWHTVTFEVTVEKGQAGKDIQNTASVTTGNTPPDEPTTNVEIYPRDPKLTSEKSAVLQKKADGNTDEKHPEVGDTLLYTIKTKNTIEDSLVKNLVISDELPEGLAYVPNSLEVDGQAVTDEQDQDNGDVTNRTVSGQFGDIQDTDWHTVTFEVTVEKGQSGKDIQNTASVTGENTPPDDPTTKTEIYPRDPKLESEKSAVLQKKAEGNKDEKHPEVGDTLLYTIKTKNTIEDSLVENLVISDQLPKGLEYVAGSLEIDGESVTDVKDDDSGDYTDGKVTGYFGDVKDTDWHTVTFEVTVEKGQAGQDIQNTAEVTGENTPPDDPTTKTEIYPREPKLASEKDASIQKKAEGNTDEKTPQVGDTLLYTIKTKNLEEDSIVKNLVIADQLPEGLEYVEGSLKVDDQAVTDAKDDDNGDYTKGTVTGQFGDIKDTDWHTITFEAKVAKGQSGKSIQNTAKVTGENTPPDEPSTETKIDPKDPKLESEKTSKISQKAEGNKDEKQVQVGDTLLYTIKAKNSVEDSVIKDLVITDQLPEGIEYVEGSLKVDDQAVTDAKDDDNGDYTKGTVTGQFGDIKDTDWHTITFEAKVAKGQSGKSIQNTAKVTGENTPPDEPSTETKIDPKDPKLESEKTSKISQKAEGNKDEKQVQVGDTLLYTIKAKNSVEDSVIKDLVITDQLPEGIEYVEGSLKVDDQAVTDAKDDDNGDYTKGTVTGQFGDIKDTDWHTVTFEAKIAKGQSGKSIQNTAKVTGENTPPDEPSTETKIDPKDPKLESEKTSEISQKAKGNTDEKQVQVGDTLLYTIKTKNSVEDSVIKDLVIADQLPEGLEYVEGSLKVDAQGVTDAKDDDNGDYTKGTVTGQFGDIKDTDWHTVTFEAKIAKGQSGKSIQNTAKVTGENTPPDEPSTETKIDPKDPKLESEKTSEISQKAKGNTDEKQVQVGDTLLYTIKTKNSVEDSVIKDLVIADQLPEGLEYVEGSLKVDAQGVTDAKDDDNGDYTKGTVTGQFGDIKDTDWHTITFEAKIAKGYEGKTIQNIAVVKGENVDEPDKPENSTTVEPPHVPEVPGNPEQPSHSEPDTPGHHLPNTATAMYNLLLAGFALVLIGASLIVWKRRKRNE